MSAVMSSPRSTTSAVTTSWSARARPRKRPPRADIAATALETSRVTDASLAFSMRRMRPWPVTREACESPSAWPSAVSRGRAACAMAAES